jgi:hypothetical protein
VSKIRLYADPVGDAGVSPGPQAVIRREMARFTELRRAHAWSDAAATAGMLAVTLERIDDPEAAEWWAWQTRCEEQAQITPRCGAHPERFALADCESCSSDLCVECFDLAGTLLACPRCGAHFDDETASAVAPDVRTTPKDRPPLTSTRGPDRPPRPSIPRGTTGGGHGGRGDPGTVAPVSAHETAAAPRGSACDQAWTMSEYGAARRWRSRCTLEAGHAGRHVPGSWEEIAG